ncbi:MAG: hypothetical protein ACI4EN_01645 [Butyrivibrio sp.]
MLRLMKYEYRKDLPLYIIIVSIIMALTAYLAFSIKTESEVNLAISSILFVLGGFGAVFFIMVIGVISYAREINSKSSFMTFMTPLNTFEIVGTKYLTLLLTTVVATLLYVGGAYLNIILLGIQFDEINDIKETLDFILIMFDTSVAELMASLAVVLFTIWLNILLTVSYSYLAVTLSSTILANRRGKGWLAVGLFVAILIASNIISNYIPTFDFGTSMMEMLLSNWLIYAFHILLIIGTYFGVSILLKKKVSL